MPRRKRVSKTTRADLASVAEKLRAPGVDAVDALVDVLTFRMELSEEECMHPFVQQLCGQDFSLEPNRGHPSKPWALVARLKERTSILKDLVQYTAPRLRSATVDAKQTNEFHVTIKQFAVEDTTAKTRTLDLPHRAELPQETVSDRCAGGPRRPFPGIGLDGAEEKIGSR